MACTYVNDLAWIIPLVFIVLLLFYLVCCCDCTMNDQRRPRNRRVIQWLAKNWPFLGCLKFEKPTNVWTGKWARLFSKFVAEVTIFKVLRNYECLVFLGVIMIGLRVGP